MLNTTKIFEIKRAYDLIYKLCVIKSFAFAKGQMCEKELFRSLVCFCEKQMKMVKNNEYRYRTNVRGLENIHEIKEKKTFCDEAFIRGYSGNCLEQSYDKKKQCDKLEKIMSLQEAILFFNEIAEVLGRDGTFQKILEDLQNVFQQHKLPFIIN